MRQPIALTFDRRASAKLPAPKVTVRLSEGVCGRLDVATDRPGVGKSMLVEAALEHFLSPAPSVDALLRERLESMHAKFDHERFADDRRDRRAARPISSRRHAARSTNRDGARRCILGDERFMVLAEQVDRRVRQGGLSCRRPSTA